VSRTDGAQVEMSLLRPVAWIAQYGLEPGKQFTLVLSEIEVDGRATVTAIGPCPPIAAGAGQVVIGRFKTHQVSNLVEVTLTSGTSFVGTNTHPVWLPDEAAWVTLEDLRPGDRLDTLAGPVAVASVAPREAISDVYNLETHGHHVYRITEDGVLVHNNAECPLGNARITQGQKSVVIGEGMATIKGAAKLLQSEGINAKWYQAWGKNFPKNRLMTPSELEAALKRNERWIRKKIADGYNFYDLGLDPTHSVRSPFYELEKRILGQKEITTIPLPRGTH
jgi:hypothetical protein